jgi:cytochrome P450
VYEIYRDPELLAAVRREVDSCMLENSDGQVQFDMDRLLHLPLLQAVYAETLRLRMHFYIVRMPDKTGMNINNWLIPRRKIIVTSTTAAHLDPKAWRSEFDDEHPIDTFWPGRFLKTEKNGFENSKIKTNTSAFSTREFDGSWIPYGGGPRQCPGRHFAKRQILLTTALIVALFNCEISETAKNVAEDLSLGGFGSGISHPACPVPFRLQRRETASS